MSSNQGKILDLYAGGGEDDRFRISRSNNMEFHYTKKIMSEYIKSDSKVIELGCATGNYGMYFADKCAWYTGVDITPDNISVFKSKIDAENKSNVTAIVGDAVNLCGFDDNSFDVVMCLGPMYHLPLEERLKVIKECVRIANKDAVIAFAYINRIGVYAGACVNEDFKDVYPSARANKYVFEHSTDDISTGIFYYTSPEEMEEDAKQVGLKVIKNCGLDFFFAANAIDKMSDEQFDCYMELADRMSESGSCTGLSNHALIVCKQ